MAFDTASLEYSVAAEQTETKAGGRHLSLPNTGAEVITLNPDKVASSIYGRDTDKDGLIDVIDRAPKEWNVSERDLRMFASLAYEDKETLEALFRGKHEDGSKYISQKELVNYADVSELTGKWELLKAESPGSGLDYAVFGNRNEKGELDSVVVAFRGTQLFSLSDIWADLKILFANTPTQATYLNDIAQFIDSLNPKNVYSTGHSLGGYLAEYFAAHTMQQKYDWSVNFQHSSLFNPAILKIDNNSSDNLKNARYMAESFTKTPVIDKSDITQDKQLYKTNSYVIKGEWVSSGNWPFSGLGEYNNTISFDFKQSDWWGKHSMSSFYEKDATGKLEKYFSYGSRIDSHYNNPYKTDTDRDGFSDGIEAKLKSDPQDADSTPFAVTEPAMASDEGMGLAIVQTEKADGSVVSVKGVEMTGTQEEGNTVYRPSENPVVDLGTEKIQSAADGVHQAVITVKGTAGDDTIVGSKGNDIIWGGLGSDTIKGNGGSDTIVFSAEDIRAGKVDTVTDFGRDDFLDLGRLRTLFSDHPENFKWENILDNTDISSSALVYKADEHTLAYRAAGSENANVFARFDEQAEVSASQFIG
jgi:putative outer membrane secretion protein